MNLFKNRVGIREVAWLICGIFIGAAVWWGVASFSRHKELPRIEPLFTDEDIVTFAEIRNFLSNLEENSNLFWCSADMHHLEYMRRYLSEAEIYFTANKHLRSLPEAERKKFYSSYRLWADDYRKICSLTERMQSHEMVPFNYAFMDKILQEYLELFRKPVNTWDDHDFLPEENVRKIIDLKSWQYVGDVYEHRSTGIQRVKICYPYQIPKSRQQKVAAFLREIDPSFQIDESGRCVCISRENITSDKGFFKLYPELQRLMDKNCRVEECLESVKRNPLSRRKNIEIIDMKPFEVK